MTTLPRYAPLRADDRVAHREDMSGRFSGTVTVVTTYGTYSVLWDGEDEPQHDYDRGDLVHPDDGEESFLASLSRSLRHKLRRKRRRFSTPKGLV